MTSITWAALVLGGFVAILLVLATYGRYRWAEATQALLSELEAARSPVTRSSYNAREIEGLPAPVQRFFRAVLRDGQPIVTGLTVRHTGTFNVTALGSRETWIVLVLGPVRTHKPSKSLQFLGLNERTSK